MFRDSKGHVSGPSNSATAYGSKSGTGKKTIWTACEAFTQARQHHRAASLGLSRAKSDKPVLIEEIDLTGDGKGDGSIDLNGSVRLAMGSKALTSDAQVRASRTLLSTSISLAEFRPPPTPSLTPTPKNNKIAKAGAANNRGAHTGPAKIEQGRRGKDHPVVLE